ncbi:hypothetical protein [Yersinia intermedia]|uniref:Uncharacterized protein n=1 Tax=Yersinia intermedia TaxID=631 RepID=A0A208ZYG1_YERIN|nr:hypothetical protein [Yersinia intermedia]OVZ85532.1 hypothetical protein CBW57_14310 [Yersinia intermedia]
MIGIVLISVCISLLIFFYKKGGISKIQILQFVLYSCLGLVTVMSGISTFNELTKSGVKVWSGGALLILSSFISVLTGVLSITWASLAFPKLREKLLSIRKLQYLNNYTVPVIFITLLFFGNIFNSYVDSTQAKKLGFNSEKDFTEAKRNNIYNADEYSKFLVDKKAKEDTELATKTEKDKIEEIEQAKKDSEYTLLSKSPFENDNGDNDIVVKFDKNNPFEMSVLKNIQSYQNASFKHNRAAMIFRDYGIDLRDFDKLVLPRCSQKVEEIKLGYKRETGAWLPYSNYVDRDVLRKEKEYRDNYNREFGEKMQHESNMMNECFYSLSQKLPNHSPRNRPE